ncbi:tumor protein D53 isoform X1 [Neoarius graeffei]|uniref:tumor protein D53 isoform X1 n=1 Tax=Neoarius graeffei TaxID=443677 RepID=UPI00298BEC75|nr:tumor protein D53 isoform X1 [Neoarius graeffei]
MEERQQGLLGQEPVQEVNEDMESEVDLNNTITEEEREEMHNELTKLEEEIVTLKQVLASKEKHHAELKHRLGMTTLSELKQNLSRSWNDVQSSTVYKKTSETLSTAGQKTTVAFSNLGTAISRKLGDMRNSQSFKSFEEKVETTVSNIKERCDKTPTRHRAPGWIKQVRGAEEASISIPGPTCNSEGQIGGGGRERERKHMLLGMP